MKFRFIILSVFIFSSITSSFSRGDGGSSGGSLGIMTRMAFFSPPAIEEVYIIDARTGSKIGVVFLDDLEYAIKNLPTGQYLFIYIDEEGNTVDEISFFKE